MCNQIEGAEFEMIPFRKNAKQSMSAISSVISVHFLILLGGSQRFLSETEYLKQSIFLRGRLAIMSDLSELILDFK